MALVSLSQLKIHQKARYRQGLLPKDADAKVREYADEMKEGDVFPPITVFRVGGKLFVADGWLRVEATKAVGRKKIEADVRDGSVHDLIMFARTVNAKHGVKRSNLDKRQAVYDLLNDPKVKNKTSKNIANLAEVSRIFVNDVKKNGVKPKGTDKDNRYYTPEGIIESLHLFADAVGCVDRGTDAEEWPDPKATWLGLVDPASDEQGNSRVRANRFIKEGDNDGEGGLGGDWRDLDGQPAKVAWCNPPFSLTDGADTLADGGDKGAKRTSRPGCEKFILKAVEESEGRRVWHVIMLLPIRVAKTWWKHLVGDNAHDIVLKLSGDQTSDDPAFGKAIRGHTLPLWSILLIDDNHLEFDRPTGPATNISAPGTKTPLECMLAYLGDREDLFHQCFGQWGDFIPAGSIKAVPASVSRDRRPLKSSGG